MDPLDLAAVARAMDAAPPSPAEAPLLARSAVIDSREATPGALFFCLEGDRTDGHRHLEGARAAGAVAAVVRRGAAMAPVAGPLPLLVVDDPRRALGRLAAFVRERLSATVVGVTGSNGKTTTKEMIGAVLSRLGPTVRSERSYNNDLGVPLTILRADASTRFLVLEMGTNHPGEIAHLAALARPHVGVVTSVGEAHLGNFGSLRAIAREKGDLLAALPPDGAAVVGGEGEFAAELADRAPCRVCTFGRADPPFEGEIPLDVWATKVVRTGRPRGVAFHLYGKMRLAIPFPGLHNAGNALAAASVGLLLGATPEDLREGLRAARPPALRLQGARAGGVLVLDDTYNANPASVEAALAELAATTCDGRRVFVFGDMGELGDGAEAEHRRVGRRAAACADVLWFLGENARHAAAAALEAGFPRERVQLEPSVELALERVSFRPLPGDVLLFKASRAAGLDRLAAAIRARLESMPAAREAV
jgi:UDP-N-acetylmuramoyl-tripeptide--D-alanyl-D-alanine ligase